MEIKIKNKDGNENSMYGDRVELSDDGTLVISGYDGLTKLDAFEAWSIAKILTLWAESTGEQHELQQEAARYPYRVPSSGEEG